MTSSIEHFMVFLAIGVIAVHVVGQSTCPKSCDGIKCSPGEACFFIHNVCMPNKPCHPIETVCAPVTCGPDTTECKANCPTGFHCELIYPTDCTNRTQACFSDKAVDC